MLAIQSKCIMKRLYQRYEFVCLEPDKMKFIDRMVADSRSVALKHTAGLSLSQQTQMTLFALFFLAEENSLFIKGTEKTLNNRMHKLYEALGISKDLIDEDGTNYYAILDILEIAEKFNGSSFASWLKEIYNPLSFVFALANIDFIVLLPGVGFDMPPWSLRISLANLRARDYKTIGEKILDLLETTFEQYKAEKFSTSKHSYQ
jgi:aspartate 4-decarboxylase